MEHVAAFVDEQLDRFIQELSEWVRIPSVSSDPTRAGEVERSARHLAGALRALHASRVFATLARPDAH